MTMYHYVTIVDVIIQQIPRQPAGKLNEDNSAGCPYSVHLPPYLALLRAKLQRNKRPSVVMQRRT